MNKVLSIGRGSTIGYKEWGAGGKKKILALHGWLGKGIPSYVLVYIK
jgi:hypothetical protein